EELNGVVVDLPAAAAAIPALHRVRVDAAVGDGVVAEHVAAAVVAIDDVGLAVEGEGRVLDVHGIGVAEGEGAAPGGGRLHGYVGEAVHEHAGVVERDVVDETGRTVGGAGAKPEGEHALAEHGGGGADDLEVIHSPPVAVDDDVATLQGESGHPGAAA